MVPPASTRHQAIGVSLVRILEPLARGHGLELLYDAGLYRGDRDYRVPDLIVYRPEHASERGVEGHAEVVFELLSPGDESREKLPFYESLGVSEVFLVDPATRAVELYVVRGGKLLVVLPDRNRAVRSEVLGVEFRPVDGPKLRLTWDGGTEDV